MTIEIKWKQVVKQGEQFLKIIAIKGVLQEKELPIMYLRGTPRMVWFENPFDDRDIGINLYTKPIDVVTRKYTTPEEGIVKIPLRVSKCYSAAEYAAISECMRRCGARLVGINKTLAKKNREWNKEGVDYI